MQKKEVIMIIVIMIPVVLFYITLLFLIFSFVICSLFCHRERKKSKCFLRKKTSSVDCTKTEPQNLSVAKKIYSGLYPYLYGFSRFISIFIGHIPSHRVRKFFLKYILCLTFDPKAVIYGGFELRSPWNIKIGRSVIGAGALLDGRNGIIIEDDVCLAQAVSVYTEQHDLNDHLFRCNDKGGSVIIKQHAWVSSKTTILPRCVVEKGSVIASGATLTKSTEAYGVYAGLPAKKIAQRNVNLQYKLGGNDFWHFY